MEPMPASTESQYSLKLPASAPRMSRTTLTFVKPAPLSRPSNRVESLSENDDIKIWRFSGK